MPIRYFDPLEKRGPWYRSMERFGRSRLGQAYARHIAHRVDPWFYRVVGNSYTNILGGVATAPLKTTGAKSGQLRVVQVTYFHDGRDVILIASNYGGAKNPQWSYNLKAHPECELGDEKFVASEIADPGEYARVYAMAVKAYKGWGDYRAKTDPIGRHIPAFRLTPRN